MWWVVLAAVLALAATVLFLYLRLPFRTPEPAIVDDGVASDPECFELLRRVARRDPAILAAIERNEKPIGLKCSNIDIVRAMKSEGAWVELALPSVPRIDFSIKSLERWFVARRSRFGTYQKDRIFFVKTAEGTIRLIKFHRPYIT
jgi:hypothetical protein